MNESSRRWVVPLISLGLLAAALWTLDAELQRVSFRHLAHAVTSVPLPSVVAALGLTALNYLVLTGYDQFAFVYAGRTLSRWRITVASFVGYAISNNVGFALLSGTSARYRFYSRWGLSAEELSRIVLFYSGTFWLGLFVLGGWSLLVVPTADLPAFAPSFTVRLCGWLLLAVSAGYAAAPFVWRRPVRVRGFDVALPRPGLVAVQFTLSILDWALAAAVLWALLPSPRPAFGLVVAGFLAAQLLALFSHVPGGLGVFESLFILFLKSAAPATTLLPALVVYRAIYYLLPLAGALVVLLADELNQRRVVLRKWTSAFGGLAVSLAPKVLSVFTFVAGAVLLFSGATPAGAGRLTWLSHLLPLGIVELSHFAGSLLGLALLVLSQGIARRLDLAYHLTLGALGLGIVTSLLKGGDYEEATILALVALAFLPSRQDFDRRTAFFEARFSAGWFSAVVAVVAASIWLGFFAYRHVEYTSDLWWRFAFRQEASRFLRASLGVTVALLVYGVSRLLRTAPPELPEPIDADIEAAERVIATQQLTYPLLVHLRDKALLWNGDRTRLHHVRRAGADVGRDGRPGRAAARARRARPRLPRARRRLRRGAGLLRGAQGQPAPVRGLRPHLREAGRGGARGARGLRPRGQREQGVPPGGAAARARGPHVPHRAGRRGPGAAADAPGRVGRVAAEQVGRREELLAGLLRRGLPRALPRRAHRAGGAARGVRDGVARTAGHRSVGGPDALPGIGTRHDGRAVRAHDALGAPAGLPVVLARHGAARRASRRPRSRRSG